MDLTKMTQTSQEAVQSAQTYAVRSGHVEVDGEHLCLALLEQPDGLIPRLLAKMEVPVEALTQALEQELARRGRRLEDASLAEMDEIWNRLRRQT